MQDVWVRANCLFQVNYSNMIINYPQLNKIMWFLQNRDNQKRKHRPNDCHKMEEKWTEVKAKREVWSEAQVKKEVGILMSLVKGLALSQRGKELYYIACRGAGILFP